MSYVGDLLDRMATNYTRGLRGYYFGLPLFFWLLTPYLMMITLIGVLCLLYVRDHTGRGLPPHESTDTRAGS